MDPRHTAYDDDLEPSPPSTSAGRALSTASSSEKVKKLAAKGAQLPRAGDELAAKGARVPRACDACRRRKVKQVDIPPRRPRWRGAAGERQLADRVVLPCRCAGGTTEQPCETCKAGGISCLFESKATKRGPPKGYVEALEKRIESMEGIIRTLAANSAGGTGNSMELLSTIDKDAKRAILLKAGMSESPEPSGDDYDVETRLAHDLDELSVDKDRFVGRGSGLHLARSIEAYANKNAPNFCGGVGHQTTPSLVEHMLQQEHRTRTLDTPLPPLDLMSMLLDAFFDHVNEVFGLVHRPSFERALAAGLLETDTSFRSLCFAMFAIGSRFVDDPRIALPTPNDSNPGGAQQSRGFNYWKASSMTASPIIVSSTLYDIQCSVLSILWLGGAASPISTWAAVGFAMRRAVDVGCHREVRERWSRSPLENQLRKRAFFALLGLDRMSSITLGRPLALQDFEVDLSPPLDIDDASLDHWNLTGGPPPPPSSTLTVISGMNCVAALYQIMGKVFSTIFTTRTGTTTIAAVSEKVAELDSLLNAWIGTIPAHLVWNSNQQDPRWLVQSAVIYSSYYCTQILIHRDFISPRMALGAFPSLAICANAARSTSHVLDLVRSRGGGLLASLWWIAPMQATTAGLILLISAAAGGGLSSSAMGDVHKCIAVLDELGDMCFIAGRCAAGVRNHASCIPIAAPSTKVPAVATQASRKRTNPTNEPQRDEGVSPSASSMSSSRSPVDSFSYSTTGSTSTVAEDLSVDSGMLMGDMGANGGPRAARKKSSNSIRRNRVSGGGAVLPTTTQDLSLGTFNGYETLEGGYYAPPPVANSLANELFAWPSSTPLVLPPAGNPQQQPQPFYSLLSPRTTARLEESSSYLSASPVASIPLANPALNLGTPSSDNGVFGANNPYPFSFGGGGEYLTNSGGGMELEDTGEWAAGFDFDSFTKSFIV